MKFSGVFAAEPLERLLKSAVANAGNNHNMDTDELFITRVTVDGGPGGGFTKRMDPRAQGRANFKRKRLSHVTIAVGPDQPKNQPRKRSGASIALSTQTTRAAAAARPARRRAPRKKQEAAAAAGAS